MEYGYNQPEFVSVEENERRMYLKGELGVRAYCLAEKLEGQDDLPVARQFTVSDLYIATEAKNVITASIPGQQILPIEFSK